MQLSPTDLEKLMVQFGLSHQEAAVVVQHFVPETLKKGEQFITQGHRVQKYAYVLSGLTREYFMSGQGEITKYFGCPGSFITDIAAFSFGHLARWSIEAVEPTQLLSLSTEANTRLEQTLPRWKAAERNILAMALMSAEGRILSLSSETAKERYLRLVNQQPTVLKYAAKQHIASFLGMSPETLSRLRD